MIIHLTSDSIAISPIMFYTYFFLFFFNSLTLHQVFEKAAAITDSSFSTVPIMADNWASDRHSLTDSLINWVRYYWMRRLIPLTIFSSLITYLSSRAVQGLTIICLLTSLYQWQLHELILFRKNLNFELQCSMSRFIGFVKARDIGGLALHCSSPGILPGQ